MNSADHAGRESESPGQPIGTTPDPSTFGVQRKAISAARDSLLEAANLGDQQLDRAFGALMRPGVDWGDLYFSEYSSESWVLEDGIVKTASHDRGRGMSARAVSGEKSGFAYSDDLDPATLLRAAKTAGAIARGGGRDRFSCAAKAPAAGYTLRAIRLRSSPIPPRWNCCTRWTARPARPTPGYAR